MAATRTLSLAVALVVAVSVSAMLLLGCPLGGGAPVRAELGSDIHGEVRESPGAARRYLFQLPADAVEVDVTLESADGELELRAVCGGAVPERDGDWSWLARAEDTVATLSLARHVESDLRAGPFLVEVRPLDSEGHHGQRRSVPFTLRAVATRFSALREIALGQSVDEATDPDVGYRRDFAVDVPADTAALRIDLVESARDLDLLVSSQGSPLDDDAAEWKAATPLGRESLVLDERTAPALPSTRRLYVSVVDPSLYGAPVKFRLAVTPGVQPPPEALVLPVLPRPLDPRQRAVAAVVEIVAGPGSGSGTLVREDGLILTARHVVGDLTGENGDIAVALDLDPSRGARDLFRAKVVASDDLLDVALLRITAGLYGQPLPPGYLFPACPVALSELPQLGDELVTIGYPEAAGTGTRAPVMYSRGVVSGFERENGRLHLKTDAFVAAGSSGGAAVDSRFRLVGVPVFTLTDSANEATLGFLVPVAELPASWRARIGEAH